MLEKFHVKTTRVLVFCFVLALVTFLFASKASASTLSLSPSNGAFEVGSTFDVSVILNTSGKTINAFEIDLRYPPDKLQVVSPSTGKSIATLWVSPPKYNNNNGTLKLQGGITDGINTTGGNIATITFRVKSTGSSSVSYVNGTKVLLHDGSGSDSLDQLNNAVFDLILPPPAGPIVVSETHGDQSKWHGLSSVIMKWDSGGEDVEQYSYEISKDPIGDPDDISDGSDREAIFKNLSDGRHYFHIKSSREGVWGGTTHFAINVDSTPPADFPINILPSKHTSSRIPVINFETTDETSGVDRYEIKLISVDGKNTEQEGDNPFFIETSSPYTPPELAPGKYDVIIRVYDQAGNIREVVERLNIHKKFVYLSSKGDIVFAELHIIKWYYVLAVLLILLVLLAILGYKMRKKCKEMDSKIKSKGVPSNVKKQLADLKKYQKKYGKLSKTIIIFLTCCSLFFATSSKASDGSLHPPLITTVSDNISNDEIPYIGGKTETVNTKVNIYFQYLGSGETYKETIHSDGHGNWLYKHSGFLTEGDYLVWAQAELGEQQSPPSPQQQILVRKTAIQFGASRISREELFLGLFLIMLAMTLLISTYIIVYFVKFRRKKKILEKEMREVEDALHRGFATLRRDIQAELDLIKEVKMSKALTQREEKLEARLNKDLQSVERKIGKEIQDVVRLENIE